MRLSKLLPAVMLLALVAAACGTGGETEPEPTDTTASEPSEQDSEVSLEGTTIVFAGPGGSLQQAYEENVFSVFEERTGADVQYAPGTLLEHMARIEAQAGAPEVDVATITDELSAQFGGRGLFEELSTDVIERLEDVPDTLRYPSGDGTPFIVLSTGIAYNTELFEEMGFPAPTSIYDFWKPEYKDRIVLWTPATTTGLLFLILLADAEGGGVNDIQPAFDKLKEIAPDIDFNLADEMSVLMQQEQVWLGWWNNIRVAQLQDEGFPVELVEPEEGTPVYTNGVAVVQDAPNRDGAVALVNFLLSDEGQELLAEHIGGGPVIEGLELPAALAERVPSIESEIFVADAQAVVENRAEWLDLWAREIE